VLLAAEQLLSAVDSDPHVCMQLEVSFLQVYGKVVTDLLDPQGATHRFVTLRSIHAAHAHRLTLGCASML
jgi:hypothetical protein